MSVTISNYRNGFMKIVTPEEDVVGDGGSALNSNFKLIDDQMLVNPMDFSANGDGSGDDTSAINTAAIYATSGNKFLYFPSGTFKVESDLTINPTCSFMGGVLKPASGVLITFNGDINATRQQIFDCSLVTPLTQKGIYFAVGSPVGTVYPEWWGASGDGSNDSYPAIQHSIDSVTYPMSTEEIPIVEFKSGKYSMSQPVYIGYDFVNYGTGVGGEFLGPTGDSSYVWNTYNSTTPTQSTQSRRQPVYLKGQGYTALEYSGAQTDNYLVYYAGRSNFKTMKNMTDFRIKANENCRGIYMSSVKYGQTTENIILDRTRQVGLDWIDSWGSRLLNIYGFYVLGHCVRTNNANSCHGETITSISHGQRDEYWPSITETGIVGFSSVIQTPAEKRAGIYLGGSTTHWLNIVPESSVGGSPYKCNVTSDGFQYSLNIDSTSRGPHHGLQVNDPVSVVTGVDATHGTFLGPVATGTVTATGSISSIDFTTNVSGVVGQAAQVFRRATSISQTNPAVVSCANHGLGSGQYVKVLTDTGMTDINDTWYQISVTGNSDSFVLNGVNATGFNASDGTEYLRYGAYGVTLDGDHTIVDTIRFEAVTVSRAKMYVVSNTLNAEINNVSIFDENESLTDWGILCEGTQVNNSFSHMFGRAITRAAVGFYSASDVTVVGNKIEQMSVRGTGWGVAPSQGAVEFDLTDNSIQQANYIEGAWTPTLIEVGDTTPSVHGYNQYTDDGGIHAYGTLRQAQVLQFPTGYSGTVTNFEDGVVGQILTLQATNNNVTIQHIPAIFNTGAEDIKMTTTTPLTYLKITPTAWAQIGATG
jgi:hypothetical protein